MKRHNEYDDSNPNKKRVSDFLTFKKSVVEKIIWKMWSETAFHDALKGAIDSDDCDELRFLLTENIYSA